jgi:DNA-binding NtrC family response regulator
VKTNFTLLIADRNPHVRTFLQREMTAAGYRTRLAENARQVLKLAFKGEPLDMIILDPDLPDADETHMLEHLLDRIPMLPVVMHTYPSEYGIGLKDKKDVVFVEKGGRSVERLKQVVYETLVEHSARRWPEERSV